MKKNLKIEKTYIVKNNKKITLSKINFKYGIKTFLFVLNNLSLSLVLCNETCSHKKFFLDYLNLDLL